jgi:hypothetical protein
MATALVGRAQAIGVTPRQDGRCRPIARHPAITATLRGAVRAHGQPVRPAAAQTSAEIRQRLGSCGDDRERLRFRRGCHRRRTIRQPRFIIIVVSHYRLDRFNHHLLRRDGSVGSASAIVV